MEGRVRELGCRGEFTESPWKSRTTDFSVSQVSYRMVGSSNLPTFVWCIEDLRWMEVVWVVGK